MRVRVLCIGILLMTAGMLQAGVLANFDGLPLTAGSSWDGSDGSGGFISDHAFFKNNYNSLYYSWDGFGYSNLTDTTAKDWGAQYNAITGSGQGGSANYAVGYDPVPSFFGIERPTMTLTTQMVVDGLYITNTNYAYYSMQQGDMFAKKFGAGDYLLLTMTGQDASGIATGSVDFYLADFRSGSGGYIVNDWRYVNLSSLGAVKSITFALSSTDNGRFGMNTPGYFAIDTVVPEPVTLALLGLGALFIRRK